MTTMQKSIVALAIAAAVGVGIYEDRQASMDRVQIQALRHNQTSPSLKIFQLQSECNDSAKQSFSGDSSAPIAGILADDKFLAVLNGLEARSAFKTLGEPVVTTSSGRGIQGRFIHVVFPVFTNPPPFDAQYRAD